MALVVAQKVPTSSTMAVPHGPAGVGTARRRLRSELSRQGAPETVIDDAVLILSELLSNSCRHARPLDEDAHRPGAAPGTGTGTGATGTAGTQDGAGSTGANGSGGAAGNMSARSAAVLDEDPGLVRAGWWVDEDGLLTLEVTDGGGPTRPRPSSPSLTARGGRGLGIVGELALDWGVRDDAPGEVTVWAVLAVWARHARRGGFAGGMVNGLGISAVADPMDFSDL